MRSKVFGTLLKGLVSSGLIDEQFATTIGYPADASIAKGLAAEALENGSDLQVVNQEYPVLWQLT
jgi:hypothetical protein